MKRRHINVIVGVLGAGAVATSALAASGTFSGSDNGSGTLSDKAAALSRINAAQEQVRRQDPGWAARKPGAKIKKRWATVDRPPYGIVEGSVPFPSSLYALDGARIWQSWHAGVLTQVYAGALRRRLSQGIVIVLTTPYPLRVSLVPNKSEVASPDRSRSNLYFTPVRGSVEIKSFRGQVITLVAYPGQQQMSFNVTSRRFRLLEHR